MSRQNDNVEGAAMKRSRRRAHGGSAGCLRVCGLVVFGVCTVSATARATKVHIHEGQSIQDAIDVGTNGDVLIVHPGTYPESINFNGKAITLRSSDGPGVTRIEPPYWVLGSVVTCDSHEGPDTVLDGFTITGGNTGQGGGGMYNDKSSPTVTNCTFTGNTAHDGGGMYNSNSSPTVTNCTFSGNSAGWWESGYGGGMYNDLSGATVTNCTFVGNEARTGGGMRNALSSPTVNRCVFTGNSAEEGGGMFNESSHPMVTNCMFRGNAATTSHGGGMCNSQSDSKVINCTFSRNTAVDAGGAMANLGSNPTVANCTLWGDTPDEIYHDGAASLTVTYSDVQGGTGETWFGTGCIDTNPLFMGDANLRLQEGSPCIDTGDNDAVPEGVTLDFDGYARVMDGDGDRVSTVDMGAYEFMGFHCNGDGMLDEFELDSDEDGYVDQCDKCPYKPNPDQLDGDDDGRGDACVGVVYLGEELKPPPPHDPPIDPYLTTVDAPSGCDPAFRHDMGTVDTLDDRWFVKDGACEEGEVDLICDIHLTWRDTTGSVVGTVQYWIAPGPGPKLKPGHEAEDPSAHVSAVRYFPNFSQADVKSSAAFAFSVVWNTQITEQECTDPGWHAIYLQAGAIQFDEECINSENSSTPRRVLLQYDEHEQGPLVGFEALTIINATPGEQIVPIGRRLLKPAAADADPPRAKLLANNAPGGDAAWQRVTETADIYPIRRQDRVWTNFLVAWYHQSSVFPFDPDDPADQEALGIWPVSGSGGSCCTSAMSTPC